MGRERGVAILLGLLLLAGCQGRRMTVFEIDAASTLAVDRAEVEAVVSAVASDLELHPHRRAPFAAPGMLVLREGHGPWYTVSAEVIERRAAIAIVAEHHYASWQVVRPGATVFRGLVSALRERLETRFGERMRER